MVKVSENGWTPRPGRDVPWPRFDGDLPGQQRTQASHDARNHQEIDCLPRRDRLIHYALHFGKYAGRLARGEREPKAIDETIVDAALVCLSAANSLDQTLSMPDRDKPFLGDSGAHMAELADAAGRFAEACEGPASRESLHAARLANADILSWVLRAARRHDVDLRAAIDARRARLAQRQFMIVDP